LDKERRRRAKFIDLYCKLTLFVASLLATLLAPLFPSLISVATTKFAFPITTGMSFNRTLWKATGAQIGREARALMNAGKAYSTFWAPVVNLAREPRWGRNIEVPSEDPFQVSKDEEQRTSGAKRQ